MQKQGDFRPWGIALVPKVSADLRCMFQEQLKLMLTDVAVCLHVADLLACEVTDIATGCY